MAPRLATSTNQNLVANSDHPIRTTPQKNNSHGRNKKTARCQKVPSLGWRWEGASLNGGGTIIVVCYLLSLYLSVIPSLHADIWIVRSASSEIGMTQQPHWYFHCRQSTLSLLLLPMEILKE
mmetsp:Transcript_32661/g.53298  ORF Transcript_32661/g.53298 Transcript_32661/m.53298 type:complete len:122 (-) Transcript_32661:450-815(-)